MESNNHDKVTAIVQTYYPERREYLGRIFQSLCAQTQPPDDIIIWDNSNSLDLTEFSIEDGKICPKIIRSNFNTLTGRYAAALVAETQLVFVQDDDIIVGPDTIKVMAEAAMKRPTKIIGAFGSRLNTKTDKPYTTGRAVIGECDVVLGRVWCCDRRALVPGLELVLRWSIQLGRCDDIIMSMAGGGGFVVSTATTNLDERGVGLSHEAGHMAERDRVATWAQGRV